MSSDQLKLICVVMGICKNDVSQHVSPYHGEFYLFIYLLFKELLVFIIELCDKV